jgi:hypothetical protein
LYSSTNVIRVKEVGEAYSMYWGEGNACRVLVCKHVKRCRHRWEDKINPSMPKLISLFLNVGCIIKAVLGCWLYLSLAFEHRVA